VKFIPTGARQTPYETFDDIKRDTDSGHPRFGPSYYETAKKAKSSKKITLK
jgi:hypothetical protein